MNLLSNALKFTQSGYVMLMVEMKAGDLVITVSDSGYGIPETFIPHLFEPFKQAQTRGAERGTGLGLAIIRQLLEKMQGSISVASNYQQMEAIGTKKSGSTFTINIPFTTSPDLSQEINVLGTCRRIAIFEASPSRFFEGFYTAWTTYRFEVISAQPQDAIDESWDYIWVDAKYLPTEPKLLKRLLRPRRQLVLVSYDTQLMLDNAIGSIPPAHVIPIKRPFIWHRIVDIVAAAAESGRASVDRSVRFAPVVDMIEPPGQGGVPAVESQSLGGSKVLLVEDNKINQRLGVKMLKTLGYSAIVANDGVEAIEKVLEYDQEIQVILMDQSMPRKDGLSATKEIREMEAAGAISRKTIIMVTAVVSSDAQAICMAAGADAFLAKPLALTKLEHTLKRYLQ
jgi:CheY-like chemotaxis protein